MTIPTAETKISVPIKPLKSISDSGFDASIQSKEHRSGFCCTEHFLKQADKVSSAAIANTTIAIKQKSTKVTPPPSKRSIIPLRRLPMANPASRNGGKRLKQEVNKKHNEPFVEDWDDASGCSKALARVLLYAVDPTRIFVDLQYNCEAFVVHLHCKTDAAALGAEKAPPSNDTTFRELPAITVAGNLKHLDSVVDAISKRPNDYAQTKPDPQTPTRAFIVIEVKYPDVKGAKAGVAVSQGTAHLGFVIGLLKKALEEKKDPTKEPTTKLALLDSPQKVEEFLHAKQSI